jgi:hypothetical protein
VKVKLGRWGSREIKIKITSKIRTAWLRPLRPWDGFLPDFGHTGAGEDELVE